jgi:hypothetical protein
MAAKPLGSNQNNSHPKKYASTPNASVFYSAKKKYPGKAKLNFLRALGVFLLNL